MRGLAGKILPLVLAAAAAYGGHRLLRTDAERAQKLAAHLAAGPVITERTRAVERRWVDGAFPRRFLPAPVHHLPCPVGIPGAASSVRVAEALALVGQGSVEGAVDLLRELHREDASSWVPGLALGSLLAREGRLTEAGIVLEELLERWPVALTIRQALAAARDGGPPGRAAPEPDETRPMEARREEGDPTAAEVLGAIHVLHAVGYVRIESNLGGTELWRALKNPIGCAKLLALRGETDRIVGAPTWAEHRLPAPGCEASAEALTTLDLYNNLIVGYLRIGELKETPERRRAELARGYNDPPHANPLLAVLRLAAVELGADREHWLWAVSNAERLLRERRQSGLGELANARLALNLAELMDSALDVGPPSARQALLAQQAALVAIALRQRQSLPADQRLPLYQGVARLTLVGAVHAGAPAALPDAVVSHLDQQQRSVVGALAFALGRRQSPEEWLGLALDGAPAESALGERANPWLAASRQDLAATLAERAAGGARQQRLRWIWRAQRVLAWGEKEPAELTTAVQKLGLWSPLARLGVLDAPAAELLFAAIVGALVWAAAAWGATQLRHRRDLMTSFYRLEARERLRRKR